MPIYLSGKIVFVSSKMWAPQVWEVCGHGNISWHISVTNLRCVRR